MAVDENTFSKKCIRCEAETEDYYKIYCWNTKDEVEREGGKEYRPLHQFIVKFCKDCNDKVRKKWAIILSIIVVVLLITSLVVIFTANSIKEPTEIAIIV